MNAEPINLTEVSDEDLTLVERELERTPHPQSTHDLAGRLAFAKTATERTQDVKKYDPYASFEVGDLIEKEYNEPLTVGSKAVEHFEGRVILKVVAKIPSPHFGCDMLAVDYPGGGVFRKYIDYMKKTRTQVLLPSNCEGRGLTAGIMAKADDPRLTELPMTERDLRTLEKNLRARLAKDARVFAWNDFWQLAAKRVDIPAEKVQEIAADFQATGRSASTEDLVRRFFGLEASSDLFDLTCLSLAALLEKKHRKDFILLADTGWGKWHLKATLNALPEGLALSAVLAEVPEMDELEKPEMSIVQDFPIKIYLSWREIASGGIKIPRSLGKLLAHAREYTFTESEENKPYTLYYFPEQNFFLGLQDFYAQYNIPQGASLTLERTGPTTFKFWVKKSKKKMSVIRLDYDAERDVFLDNGEDAYTYAEPNKIIYIERETLGLLLPLTDTREGFNLRDLVVTIFRDPVLSTSAHSLHFLRAYHLIDLVRQTTQEDVEYVLVNSPEFTKSDKKKGVFTYREPFIEEEEAGEGAYAGAFEEEAAPEAYTPEEAALEAVAEEMGGYEPDTGFEPEAAPPAEPAAPPAAPPAPGAAAPKKGKEFKKRKPKEGGSDKGPRPKKSERRVIEEKIAEEESERDALAAVKEKEEETPEQQRVREKKDEIKPAPKKVEAKPSFGIFGDLLKTALKKKPEEEEPGEAPEAPAENPENKPEGEESK
ncbi:MAG TPA: hypothetical protein P5119_02165 [Candidatus Aminicenantes bacterium]|nr:hypothetical protein [Candidatus Aminicenantes bacterium]HRY64126.1 hypothetical protein [Candidatus Aminicenantes bacterium]HRZ71039.1 hypothetical protein [Candidatus Aminicenantes bacterium]